MNKKLSYNIIKIDKVDDNMKYSKYLLLILLFPIFIGASTFSEAKQKANNYKNKFDTFDRFLRVSNMYDVKNKMAFASNGFTSGGMISHEEFNITKNGNSRT